ncbi:sodium-dependent bicarbonate transport family permease [Sulfitobacter sp. S190]|uniref:sodium-dependent bicarbonate transport family permease n=1 Tax=Sulfitobacter sp. S190 TaxID=2867022 RepID=UPI0021A86198|nr:sodium-dependent bicarbonate transport family permease [Sulfitobacter sp. S190]UWR22849.1 sodium-dependent bicarbonate transport family permease [Sulfitobacter sp. S190]
MDILADIATTVLSQLQKPTLAFLLGGMMLAALGSKLEVPTPVYKFVVLLLLLKVGLGAGISIREADLVSLAVPAAAAALTGIAIVLLGSRSLARLRGVSPMDGMATVGLFGAVSASTLAAAMAMLDADGIAYEGFIGALYPFMDIAALVTAILMAKMAQARSRNVIPQNGAATMALGGTGSADNDGPSENRTLVRGILTDTLQSGAISALLLGIAIGVLGRPEAVYASFYEPLFRGLLSILMLVMGMEAWSRLSELRKVAHAYVLYGLSAPLVHGAIGFGLGMIAHQLTGFSAGGIVLLAVMAASSSDISGPPTMRGALPEANPSAYVGASTGLGTPVAILSIPLWIWLADLFIGL